MYDFLKENKVLLASVPVINYVIYLIYSFYRNTKTGFFDLAIAAFGLPLTLIGMVLLFLILRILGKESPFAIYTLTFFALISILHTLYRIIFYKPITVKRIKDVASSLTKSAGSFVGRRISDKVTSSVNRATETLSSTAKTLEQTSTEFAKDSESF